MQVTKINSLSTTNKNYKDNSNKAQSQSFNGLGSNFIAGARKKTGIFLLASTILASCAEHSGKIVTTTRDLAIDSLKNKKTIMLDSIENVYEKIAQPFVHFKDSLKKANDASYDLDEIIKNNKKIEELSDSINNINYQEYNERRTTKKLFKEKIKITKEQPMDEKSIIVVSKPETPAQNTASYAIDTINETQLLQPKLSRTQRKAKVEELHQRGLKVEADKKIKINNLKKLKEDELNAVKALQQKQTLELEQQLNNGIISREYYKLKINQLNEELFNNKSEIKSKYDAEIKMYDNTAFKVQIEINNKRKEIQSFFQSITDIF